MSKVYLEDLDPDFERVSELVEAVSRYNKAVPSDEGYFERDDPALDAKMEMWGDPDLLEKQKKAEQAVEKVNEVMRG